MSQPVALYRHFDAKGRLLYVGISLSAAARLSQHRDKPWFKRIAHMTTQWLPSRQAALAAEAAAIKAERPKHNIAHRVKKARRKAPVAAAVRAGKFTAPNCPKVAEQYRMVMDQLLHPERAYRHPDVGAPVPKLSQSLESAFLSPTRRQMFAEGKLKPLDREKWEAGGYGPDPFGIQARKATPTASRSVVSA